MDDLEKKLKNIGFSEEEALVYVAVLRNGRLGVSDIVFKTGLKRTSVYRFVESLLEKGFLSRYFRGKKTLYEAESPKKIMADFDKKREEFFSTLPSLLSLHDGAYNKPLVKFHENRNGILDVYRDFGAELADVYSFFSPSKFLTVFGKKKMDEIDKLFSAEGRRYKGLVERSLLGKRYVDDLKKEKDSAMQAKVLPKDFKIEVDILLCGNKVAMISFDYLMAVVIENNQIADFHRSVAKFFWSKLK